MRSLLVAAALILASCMFAAGRDAPAQTPQAASDKPSQQNAPGNAQGNALVNPPDATPQPDQPLSLGEAARLARARKNSQARAVRIFDDENMPRAPRLPGEKAPGFADLGSGAHSSSGSGSGGKVTLLDFWASWCGPCRNALPGLKHLQSVYGGDQLDVISVDEDDDEGAGRRFVQQNGMNWTQRFDSNHQMMRQYGASALPTYILIGKDGTIVQQYVGDDPGMPVIDRIGPDLKKSLDGKS
jgi:thiol-disulfide isomerase/thioredoxin